MFRNHAFWRDRDGVSRPKVADLLALSFVLATLLVFAGCGSNATDPGGNDQSSGSNGGNGDNSSDNDQGNGGNNDGSPPSPPHAAFRSDRIGGDIPFPVTFTDLSTGEVTSWEWSFGDGGSSSFRNPTHTYQAAGLYTVSLTVRGPAGSDHASSSALIRADAVIQIGPLGTIGPFFPSRTRGDCEFGGHGPRVTSAATIDASSSSNDPQQLMLNLVMSAEETQSNWSTAGGMWHVPVYNVPPGFHIRDILSPQTLRFDYTDTDHAPDDSPRSALGWIRIVGDTEGDDICNTTMDDTHIEFHDLTVRIRITHK